LRRRRLVVVLAIAGALLGAFAAWGPRQPTRAGLRSAALMGARWAKPFVTVAAVQPPAMGRYGIGLVVGDRLPAGAPVLTGKGGRVALLTRRGSEFTLNENTQLSLGGDRASGALRRGEIYCRSRLHEIRRIATAAGDIHLLGTSLDAAVRNADTVTVTVVQGKVRLANRHGEATVEAGRQAVLTLAQAPSSGVPVSTTAATAWYDGRNRIMSDFGDIVYTVERRDGHFLAQEIWTMHADGSGKRFVKAYVGCIVEVGPWLAGSQWVLVLSYGAKADCLNMDTRQVVTEGHYPILHGRQAWLLDVETGREVEFLSLPEQYQPYVVRISPDGSQAVFAGSYERNKRQGTYGNGPWLYDVQTGAVREVTGGGRGWDFSWSPDGDAIATSWAENQHVDEAYLRLIDTDSSQAKDLGIRGYHPVFSPDGNRLAYCADYAWVPKGQYENRIYVLDLRTMQTMPITPVTTRAESASWSPDGKYVAYIENHETYTNPDDGIVLPDYVLCVAAADGSGVKQLYRAKNYLRVLSWSEQGDAIYVSTSEGVHRVAPDSSGVTDLGGTEQDSLLSPEEHRDMDGALADLRDAVYWFTIGMEREDEGKVAECKEAYAKGAAVFAAIPWRRPLAQLSSRQLLLHADAAQAKADRSEADILSTVCYYRLDILGVMLTDEGPKHGGLPAEWLTAKGWVMGRWNTPAWVEQQFAGCPAGGEWVYTPPKGDPVAGQVMLRCPRHPENKWTWSQPAVDLYDAALKHPAR
jgi:hypothetical protein